MKVLKEVISTYIEEDGKIKITETPLIRCGECEWWVSAEESIFNGYCSKQIDAFNLFDETDFCSYGERRTDEKTL